MPTSPRRTTSVRRHLIHAVATMLIVLTVSTGLAITTPSAAGAGGGTMTITGRGYGHGRGLSQYGAEGYGRQGWTSARILDHYYSNTVAGQASAATSHPVDQDAVRIRLARMTGRSTRVTVYAGSITLAANSGSVSVPADTRMVEIARGAGGDLMYRSSLNRDCSAGGWTSWRQSTATEIKMDSTLPDQSGTRPTDWQSLLGVCDSTKTWYPGSISTVSVNGTTETVNTTTVEKQLRSVVPNESPASWTAAALQAQSVAARSYALSYDPRYSYADTCDTTTCQVYKGWYAGAGTNPPFTTHVNTDAQINATAGLVRLFASGHSAAGQIARTEFSSTSGGWTAGGTFPAVQDLGDSISPLHTWTRTVSVSPLESAYGRGGSLVSIDVTKRNGLGAGGGRVLTATLRFSNGVTKSTTGNDIRSRLGLLSDWFFTGNCTPDDRYIDAVFRLFVRRGASSNDVNAWCGHVRSDNRSALTNSLAVSDEWAGTQIADLYQRVLHRSPEAGGRSYWLGRVQAGMRIEDIAAHFYGSEEYFLQNGKTHHSFVTALYQDLQGRPADGSGRAYWVDLLDRGRLSRSQVASQFYASEESRGRRVDDMYRTILDRRPDSGGRRYWMQQLLSIGEVSLASNLAASYEYYLRATR